MGFLNKKLPLRAEITTCIIVKYCLYIVSHFFDVYFAWRPLHSVAGIYILCQIRVELWQRLRYAHCCAAEVETAPTNATIRKDSKFVLDFASRNIKNDAVVAELAHLPCTLAPAARCHPDDRICPAAHRSWNPASELVQTWSTTHGARVHGQHGR